MAEGQGLARDVLTRVDNVLAHRCFDHHGPTEVTASGAQVILADELDELRLLPVGRVEVDHRRFDDRRPEPAAAGVRYRGVAVRRDWRRRWRRRSSTSGARCAGGGSGVVTVVAWSARLHWYEDGRHRDTDRHTGPCSWLAEQAEVEQGHTAIVGCDSRLSDSGGHPRLLIDGHLDFHAVVTLEPERPRWLRSSCCCAETNSVDDQLICCRAH